MTLDTQIKQAEEAATQVRELAEMQATAQQLPDLLLQQQTDKDRKEAERQLEAAKKRAEVIMAEVLPRCKQWKERLLLVTLELVELIDEVPAIQNEIFIGAKTLSAAAYALDEVKSAPARDFGQGQTGLESVMSVGLSPHPGGISEVWKKIGGLDPALNLLPAPDQASSVEADIRALVRKRVRSGIYTAAQAHAILNR